MSEIKMPTNADEAMGMALIGMAWLQNHAPEKLTELHRELQAEAGRAGFIEGYDSCWFQHYGTTAPEHATTYSANQYADSIRNAKDGE